MSKKHYIAIAASFKRGIDAVAVLDNQQARNALVMVAEDVAVIMAADNPSFDAKRFLAACGVTA